MAVESIPTRVTAPATSTHDGNGRAKTTMVALKKTEPAPGLTFCSDVSVPTIGPRDVLIAVSHAGICGTDRHIYEWDQWSANRVPVGTTTGHEFVGKVVAI